MRTPSTLVFAAALATIPVLVGFATRGDLPRSLPDHS